MQAFKAATAFTLLTAVSLSAPYTASALPAPLIWTLGLCVAEFCWTGVEQKAAMIHSPQGLMQQNIRKAKARNLFQCQTGANVSQSMADWHHFEGSKNTPRKKTMNVYQMGPLRCCAIQPCRDKHWLNIKLYREDCSFWILTATAEYWWKAIFMTYLVH